MKKNLLLIISLFVGYIANAQSWTMQASGFPSAGEYPMAISITDASTAWALAYDGAGTNLGLQDFTRTTDGGTTWTAGKVELDTNYRFSGISAIDGMTAFAMMYNNTVGSGGGIWKTTDGGTSWTQIGVGSIFNATSFPDVVHFWDASNGFALGDPNTAEFEIYTTTDGGATWVPTPAANIPNPLAGEYGIVNDYEVVGNTIWFGTNKGRVFKSIDRGLNWTVASVPSSAARTISTIAFRDANVGICTSAPATGTSTMYKSTDGGATWVLTASTGTRYLSELANIPGTNIFVSCGASTVAGMSAGKTRGSSYTIDDGASWVLIDSAGAGTVNGYTKLAFLDISTGWAGGFNVDQITDGIYKWSPGTVLGVANNSVDLHSVSVYPNPTNGILNLNFKVKNSDVNVMIFDMVGNLVKNYTFANYNGIFTKTLDCSNLAKGIYNVVVETGAEKFNNKVVVQ